MSFILKEKRKILTLAIFVFLLFSFLIIQFFSIQIIQGEYWSKLALAQHEKVIVEPFRRGAFFSNTSLKKGHPEKEQPMVIDVIKFHLFIDPLSLPDVHKKEISQKLATFFCLNAENKQKYEETFYKESRSRKIASWLSRQTKEEIEEWWKLYAKLKNIPPNAIYFTVDYQRSYPFGSLLGQVLHTIREEKEAHTKQALPTGGLEAYFNNYLKGKEGKRKIYRSPLNNLAATEQILPPQHGADLYLTINHYIQAIAEEELEKGVKRSSAKGGWAVMMDPYSGEILAMAQYPFFNPTHYRDYFNDPTMKECAKVKAITNAFELGSIMKPITIALCLKGNQEWVDQGKKSFFDLEEKISTQQTIFPGRASKPLKDLSFHKYLNMYMAIQKSSNIYMALLIERLIERLGPDWVREELEKTFGFGKKTGMELPAESLGFVPTPGKKYPNGALEWSLPTPYSLAIGYNILATSLQMVRAYAVFANGGKLVIPTLIRKIVKVDHEGNKHILLDNTHKQREADFPQVLDKKIVDPIVRAIKFTTKEGGSARLAEIYGYTEAGKTATAEKIENGFYSKTKHISSFIGFSPANLNPKIKTRFVLLVSIDEPEATFLKGGGKNHLGGTCAAPIFREIAKRTLEYLGVTPDDPCGYPSQDPRFDPDKADWLKEVRKLNLLYEEWNG